MQKIDWLKDSFENYETELEWIEAYQENPCPNCGMPGVLEGAICINCRTKLI